MESWKKSAFWLHLGALIVPALLEAFTKSGSPQLMLIAQVGAGVYTLAQSLYHSTPAPKETVTPLLPPTDDVKKPAVTP